MQKSFSKFLLVTLCLANLLLFAPTASAQTCPATVPAGQTCPSGCIQQPPGPDGSSQCIDPSTPFIGSPWIGSPEKLSQELQSGEPSLGPFTTANISYVMSAIILGVGGTPTQVPAGPGADGKPTYRIVYQGGAAEIVGNLTASLYQNKPASSVEYLADLGSNLGIVKPAYAQGLGFSAFSPVLELWKLFRNIAYLAFVAIFIVIGFMIMFRRKIDPRTVVTIQDALPRIVVTLLLVTFSYAIAGLIVDLSELAIRITANTLITGEFLGVKQGPEISRNDLLSSSVFKLVNPLRNVDNLVGGIRATQIGGAVPSWLAGLTVGVVLWLAGFWVMFKIFFALLGPYVSIILSVIFAPFQILAGAIPGNTEGVTSWLKNIVANAAVFPVTFLMLTISAFLQSGPTLQLCDPNISWFGGAGGSALWCTRAEEISLLWTPIGINLGTAVGHLAGFGILFAIPKVVEIVREALKIKPSPLAAGTEELKKAFAGLPLVKNAVS